MSLEHPSVGETGTAPLTRAVLTVIELPIAYGVGVAAFQGAIRLGCRLHPCYDVEGVAVLLVAFPAAVVAGIVYWYFVAWRNIALRTRVILDCAAALLGIAVYAVPRVNEMRAEAQERARAQTYEALKRGAHAPPGVAPPMFDVVDEGASAVVTNKGPKRHFIALARVLPARTASSGWRSCPMRSPTVEGFEFHSLAPGESARYFLIPHCADEYAGAAIEYRVDTDPPVWWSDSAIAMYEGRPFPPVR